MQRHLQLHIEAQGKYLQSVLEKAQETLRMQNIGSAAGLEAAKVQISELVSKVSTQSLTSAFPDLQDRLCQQQMLMNPRNDGSMDSCLTTSYEGSHKEQEANHSVNLCLRSYNKGMSSSFLDDKKMREDPMMERIELRWGGELRGNNSFLPPKERRRMNQLSMSIGLKPGGPSKDKNEDEDLSDKKMSFFDTKLDLNSHHDNSDVVSSCKQIDLNGLSWS